MVLESLGDSINVKPHDENVVVAAIKSINDGTAVCSKLSKSISATDSLIKRCPIISTSLACNRIPIPIPIPMGKLKKSTATALAATTYRNSTTPCLRFHLNDVNKKMGDLSRCIKCLPACLPEGEGSITHLKLGRSIIGRIYINYYIVCMGVA